MNLTERKNGELMMLKTMGKMMIVAAVTILLGLITSCRMSAPTIVINNHTNGDSNDMDAKTEAGFEAAKEVGPISPSLDLPGL